MGTSVSCCLARDEHKRPLRLITANRIRGAVLLDGDLFTQAEALDLEWSIVGSSVGADEMARLRALRDMMQAWDDHPACDRRPLTQEAQTLLRFLRGREGDVPRAAKMFHDSLNWRVKFDLESKIAAWRREFEAGVTPRAKVFKVYCSDAHIGLDIMGLPLWLMRVSTGDPAGFLREVGREAMLVHSLLMMEDMHARLREAMFRKKAVVKGCIQVVDVGDYGCHGVPCWRNRMWEGAKIGKTAFQIFDYNYPETVRKVFIVRTGPVTLHIYQLADRLNLIPRRTKVKMRLFGAEAAKWLDELRGELAPGGQLPAFLACDTEEAFATALPTGGLVPVGAGSGAVPCHPPRRQPRANMASEDADADTNYQVLVAKADSKLWLHFCVVLLGIAVSVLATIAARALRDSPASP